MKIYRLLFSILFLLFVSPSLAEHIRIVQVSDVHLSETKSNYHHRNVEESVPTLKKAIEEINKTDNVDFVAFTGDNIDDFKKAHLLKFLEIVKGLNKPYYIAMGNHDATEFSELPKETYMKIVKKHSKYQKKAEGNYYFKPNKDVVVIVLDGVINKIPSSMGYYSSDTITWLEETLDKFKNKKVIIMQHFPLVEPFEFESHRVKYPEKYLNLLKRSKNVKAVLAGHYHGYGLEKKDGIYHIAAPALVSFESQFLIIDIDYDDNNFDLKTEIIKLP